MQSAAVKIIGLGGGSASGKTTFVSRLRQEFPESELCIISQDHYYKALSEQIRDDQGEINFDHPNGIDFKRLRKDIRSLMAGKPVRIVEYTFNNPAVFPKEIVYEPAPVVMIEGLFAFADTYLRKMYDYKWFIDTSEEIAFQRRLSRDVKERGMSELEVRYQWTNHVLPAYQAYLYPHKSSADLLISNNLSFEKQLGDLIIQLKTLMQ